MKNPLLPTSFVAALVFIIASPVASTAPFTWTAGSGSNTNWSTGTNWTGGVPANDGTANLQFTNSPAPGSFSSIADTAYNINSISFTGGTAFNISGSALTFTGPSASIVTTLTSGSVTNTISNDIALPSAVELVVNSADAVGRVIVLSGDISGTGSVRKSFHNGVLRLTGDNSFSGGVTVNRGVLGIGSNTALGTGGALTVNSGTAGITIDDLGSSRALANSILLGLDAVSTSAMLFDGGFTFAGNVTLQGTLADSRYLAVEAGANLTLNGNILSEASVTNRNFRVAGSTSTVGTMILNGDGAYTGNTTVGLEDVTARSGVVYFNGDFTSSSNTVIYNGMTLRGTGSISTTEVRTGATLAPGGQSALGNLEISGDVDLLDGSTFEFNLESGGLSDSVTVSGDFAINTGVTLNLLGTLDTGAYQLTAFENPILSPYGTFDTILLNGSAMDWTASGYSVSYAVDGIYLIPEPSTVAYMLGLGLLLVFVRRVRSARR